MLASGQGHKCRMPLRFVCKCKHLFAGEHQAGLDCKLEACTAGQRDLGLRQSYGTDGPCQRSTNIFLILESRPACTFSSEQRSTPTAEEDGVSVPAVQVTVVLHRGLPCLCQSVQPALPSRSRHAQVCVHKSLSLPGIHTQTC